MKDTPMAVTPTTTPPATTPPATTPPATAPPTTRRSSTPSTTSASTTRRGSTPRTGAGTDTTERDGDASVDASLPRSVTETPDSVEQDPAMLEQTVLEQAVLEQAVLEAGAMLHSSRYRLITALATYDTAGHWVFTGAVTCAHWALGHDTEEQHDERERRDTHLSFRIEPDGMGVIHARIPAIELGRIQAAIDCLVMQSTRTDTEDPRPSLGRQRALALVDLATTSGPDPVTTGQPGQPRRTGRSRVATEVIVHVRSDGVSLHDGTPLADSVIAEVIDNAFIRVLIHDAENRPVNASTRRRHPTPRQKRVVDERDPRCVDCGGTELLQYDHDPDYEITKRTHTDELARRCPRCHAARHQRDRHQRYGSGR